MLFAWNRCGCYGRSRPDPDRLDVYELTDAEGGEFAAITTVLDAPKWESRIRCSHAVAYGAKVPPSLIRPL